METDATLRQISRALTVVPSLSSPSSSSSSSSSCLVQFSIPRYETWQKRATKRTNGWVFATPLILVCRDPRVVESCDSLNRAFAQVNYPSRSRVHCCPPDFLARKEEKRDRNARGGSDYPLAPLSRYQTRNSRCVLNDF